MQTLPHDVTKAGRGKAQKAVLSHLHALPHGQKLHVSDLARAPQLRRVHYASIERAVAALVKRGVLSRDVEPGFGARVWVVAHTHV